MSELDEAQKLDRSNRGSQPPPPPPDSLVAQPGVGQLIEEEVSLSGLGLDVLQDVQDDEIVTVLDHAIGTLEATGLGARRSAAQVHHEEAREEEVEEWYLGLDERQ